LAHFCAAQDHEKKTRKSTGFLVDEKNSLVICFIVAGAISRYDDEKPAIETSKQS